MNFTAPAMSIAGVLCEKESLNINTPAIKITGVLVLRKRYLGTSEAKARKTQLNSITAYG
jgi:hypothetical protein